MDSDRLIWLFGPDIMEAIDAYDLEEEGDRMTLVEEYLAQPYDARGRRARMAVRTVVANQILDDDPPETWQTVQRLEAGGLDREQIVSQLTILVSAQLDAALASRTPLDPDAYAAALDSLPLPTSIEIALALVERVRAKPGVSANDHVEHVVASLQEDLSELVGPMVEHVLDDLIDGPLHYLPDDSMVHVPDLVGGRTFTHRHTESEAELGTLNAGFDLGAFTRFDTVRLADGTEIEQFSVERTHLGWSGPEGWLDDFEPGDLLSITADTNAPDGGVEEPIEAVVSITRCDPEPIIRDEVVSAVREAYEALVAEPGLPVSGEELTLWLCHRDSDLFTTPQPPLAELCAEAGLELRAGEVAHDEEIWRRALWASRQFEVFDMVPESRWRRVLGRALEVLDDPDAPADEVRSALDECAEPEALDVLTDVLFPYYLEPADEYELGRADAPGRLFELVNRALAVAKRPREIATAEYLACVLYERCGSTEVAEGHLARAVQADVEVGPITERMGWYRFDRGDARGAMQSWNLLEGRHEAAATIEPFLDHTDHRDLGRNDACWCGSGRKFKRCHLGSLELPALPDRVGWLSRKATLWIDHASHEIRHVVAEMAMARVTGDPDSGPEGVESLDADEIEHRYAEAFDDPIVIDAALHEGGLFRLFLHERGPLLPEDEQLLAAAWLTIDRSVHEVTAVAPGSTVTLRDVATGDVTEVRERHGSRVMRVGERYCARVVPDGEGHQIIGRVFGVRTGHESAVLDLCAKRDGAELCAWVGALHADPEIVHEPGLIDRMIDRTAIGELLDGFSDDAEEAAVMEALSQEIARQSQAAWLDEQIPALGGLTPREAAADPTRRGEVVRLLDEFDRVDTSAMSPGVGQAITWDISALRRELGLDE